MGELTPYICVADARRAIEWYVDVLGAEVVLDPIVMDDGGSATSSSPWAVGAG